MYVNIGHQNTRTWVPRQCRTHTRVCVNAALACQYDG